MTNENTSPPLEMSNEPWLRWRGYNLKLTKVSESDREAVRGVSRIWVSTFSPKVYIMQGDFDRMDNCQYLANWYSIRSFGTTEAAAKNNCDQECVRQINLLKMGL